MFSRIFFFGAQRFYSATVDPLGFDEKFLESKSEIHRKRMTELRLAKL